MPLITVNTSLTLEKKQKEAIKSGLGKAIALLPGKSEKILMVDISDGHSIYFGGEEAERAYVDVRIMKSGDFEQKDAFTRAVFDLLYETIGLKDSDIFVIINEYDMWGGFGKLNR
jgi:phenylpyruvate tautomerase PptA (4-oxalocrotonate tautomerase family)